MDQLRILLIACQFPLPPDRVSRCNRALQEIQPQLIGGRCFGLGCAPNAAPPPWNQLRLVTLGVLSLVMLGLWAATLRGICLSVQHCKALPSSQLETETVDDPDRYSPS